MNRKAKWTYERWTVTGALVAACAVVAVLGGCSGPDPADGPPPVYGPGSAEIATPYNGWNYGTWTTCDHGNRLYYTFGSAGQALWGVAGDPTCAPGRER